MTARSRQRMLRDRKKLLDSLRAYREGEIPAVAGEEELHFIESIERRLKALNADLRGLEAAARKREKGAVPSRTTPAQKHSTNQAI